MSTCDLTNHTQPFDCFTVLQLPMSRFLRPWRICVYICIAVIIFVWRGWWGSKISPPQVVVVQQWDTFDSLFQQVSSGQSRARLKLRYKNNPDALQTLQPWQYSFSGTYTFEEFFDVMDQWPQVTYTSLTILEWRSIYDVDQYLVLKNLISSWEYIAKVRNGDTIRSYAQLYDFLDRSPSLETLEGYLYPETYFVSKDWDLISELLWLQLAEFDKKIWQPYGDRLQRFSSTLRDQWYWFDLTPHDIVILASVIEKEERNDDNKPKIASVFFNRLETNMRIDADITLCYGLKTWYETCTPDVIVQNLYDDTNVYNTRQLSWLPPTPISNIHISSLLGVLDAEPSDSFYYLHDPTGTIHLSENLQQHNNKKSKYLR